MSTVIAQDLTAVVNSLGKGDVISLKINTSPILREVYGVVSYVNDQYVGFEIAICRYEYSDKLEVEKKMSECFSIAHEHIADIDVLKKADNLHVFQMPNNEWVLRIKITGIMFYVANVNPFTLTQNSKLCMRWGMEFRADKILKMIINNDD